MQKDDYSAEEVRVLINMFDPKPRYRVSFIPNDQYAFDHFDTMYKYYSYGLKLEFTQIFMITFNDDLLIICRKIK